MGLVEIYGKVSPCTDPAVTNGIELVSPVSGAKCVYYSVKVDTYESRGGTSTWTMGQPNIRRVPFYVSDGTGSVLVDQANAVVEINRESKVEYKAPLSEDCMNVIKKIGSFETEAFLDARKKQGATEKQLYLAKNMLSWSQAGRLGVQKFTITEKYLSAGDSVYVLGTAMKNPHVESSSVNAENLMVSKGKGEKLFYISDSTELEILEQLKKRSSFWVLAGAIIAVLGLTGVIWILLTNPTGLILSFLGSLLLLWLPLILAIVMIFVSPFFIIPLFLLVLGVIILRKSIQGGQKQKGTGFDANTKPAAFEPPKKRSPFWVFAGGALLALGIIGIIWVVLKHPILSFVLLVATMSLVPFIFVFLIVWGLIKSQQRNKGTRFDADIKKP